MIEQGGYGSQPLPDPAGHNALVSVYKIDQSFFVNDVHSGGVVILAIHCKQENLVSAGEQAFIVIAIERNVSRFDLWIGLVASVFCHGNKFVGLGIQLICAGIDQISTRISCFLRIDKSVLYTTIFGCLSSKAPFGVSERPSHSQCISFRVTFCNSSGVSGQ